MAKKERPIYITDAQGYAYVDCANVAQQISRLCDDKKDLEDTILNQQGRIATLVQKESVQQNRIKHLEDLLASKSFVPQVQNYLRELKIGDRFSFANSSERVYVAIGRTGRMLQECMIPAGNICYFNPEKNLVSYCDENLVVIPRD